MRLIEDLLSRYELIYAPMFSWALAGIEVLVTTSWTFVYENSTLWIGEGQLQMSTPARSLNGQQDVANSDLRHPGRIMNADSNELNLLDKDRAYCTELVLNY